ncbi:MAG: cyclic peptide export ABC transporter [Lautropia sp.]|nr:cyclic peptide export ABC transporter [Lautropia sp.]
MLKSKPIRERNDLIRLAGKHVPLMLLSSLMGMFAGYITVAILTSVTDAVSGQTSMTSTLLFEYTALCILVLGCTVVSQLIASHIGLKLVADVRENLSRKILLAPIDRLERYRKHRLIPVLTEDIGVVSDAFFVIAETLVSIAVITGCAAYLFYLSPELFGILLVALIIGVTIQYAAQSRGLKGFLEARNHEDDLHKAYRDISDGAKELRINRVRRWRLYRDGILANVERIRESTTRSMSFYIVGMGLGSALFFMMIGVILAWGDSHPNRAGLVSGFVVMLVFLKGPVDQVLSVLPHIGRAKVAIDRIAELARQFNNPESGTMLSDQSPSPVAFESIRMDAVRYEYPSSEQGGGFSVGPIDLELAGGQIVFLVGDNGSGKTTLIKVLLGLYPPSSGSVLLNGAPVDESNRDDYRQLFTTVFSDFHLFESVSDGMLADSDDADHPALAYLKRLDIDRKVSIKDGTFTTLDLSTGQRKRLALVNAYVEARPVYVFDEWAADQDPTFRHIFYTELLPDLRDRGFSVLVISHDDKYFGFADRVIRLENGQVIDKGKPTSSV